MNTLKKTPENAGLGRILIYLCGQFGGNVLNMVFGAWILYFYTSDTGGRTPLVSMIIMAVVLPAGRFLDAFFDPTIGYWSDKTRTRLGRRVPFMLVGTPVMVAAFMLLFHPIFPAGSLALTVTTILLITIFWFGFTGAMGPYLGLMPEIAITDKARVILSTLMAVAMLLATGYQGIVVPMLIGDKPGNDDFSKVAFLSGAICFVFFYITALGIREKPLSRATEGECEHYSFKSAFVWTFRNKPFVIFIFASVLQYLGFASLTAGIPFIVEKLMDKPVSFVGKVYLINIPCFVAGFFIVNHLASRVGKVRLYKVCLLLLALLLPLLFFIGRVDLPVSPATAGLILMGLLAFPISGNMVLPMAILADIVDHDAKLTGHRREAMYFGMQGMMQKMATAGSQGMQALLFAIFGHSSTHHLGINLLGPVAGVSGLLGFLIFLKYPLHDEKKGITQESP